MDQSAEDHDALIQQFCSITAASPSDARTALESSSWEVESAVAMWYAEQEEEDIEEETQQHPPATAQHPSGGRTLGGGPAPAPASSSSAQPTPATRRPVQRGGLRTLQDLQGDSGGGHGHGHDHDDDDEKDQEFFAGGDKSGLAVQQPAAGRSSVGDHINSILDRARRNIPRPGGEDDEEPSNLPTHFTGRGVTLGGDDAPSEVIEDEAPRAPERPPRVRRVLHLWRNGFSVDDGDLYRYDDPANAETLEMINRGAAPLSLLNVQPGQEVDLEVSPHRDEDYKPQPKKYKPFSGSGQRLGSPTPGAPTSAYAPPPAASSSTSSAPAATTKTPSTNVDESQPVITLQIRLGDGTRLQSRFNTSHTVGDVYGFVNAASPASSRQYALMTTFPSKELDDKDVKLGDLSEFKRGGVVVQKWK